MAPFPSFAAARISPLTQNAASDYAMYSSIKTQVASGTRRPTIPKANVVNIDLSKRGSKNQDIASHAMAQYTDINGNGLLPYACGYYDGESMEINNGDSLDFWCSQGGCIQTQMVNNDYSSWTITGYNTPFWSIKNIGNYRYICPSQTGTGYDPNGVLGTTGPVTQCNCGGALQSAWRCS